MTRKDLPSAVDSKEWDEWRSVWLKHFLEVPAGDIVKWVQARLPTAEKFRWEEKLREGSETPVLRFVLNGEQMGLRTDPPPAWLVLRVMTQHANEVGLLRARSPVVLETLRSLTYAAPEPGEDQEDFREALQTAFDELSYYPTMVAQAPDNGLQSEENLRIALLAGRRVVYVQGDETHDVFIRGRHLAIRPYRRLEILNAAQIPACRLVNM